MLTQVSSTAAEPQRARPSLAKAALKRKCSPEGEHFVYPCYSQGDVHGRIRFDGFATAKTCV